MLSSTDKVAAVLGLEHDVVKELRKRESRLKVPVPVSHENKDHTILQSYKSSRCLYCDRQIRTVLRVS